MSNPQQVLKEPEATAGSGIVAPTPKPSDDLAYEDAWYQVLKQRNDETPEPK